MKSRKDNFTVLAINPGSTSTKLAIYSDRGEIWRKSLSHDTKLLSQYREIADQLGFRKKAVLENISRVEGFTAANFDMIMHYRPTENVIKRPIKSGGKGFNIIGHLEIMIPLFAKAIFERVKQ